MKNLSLILNVILLIAVGFLYFKVYNDTAPVSNQYDTKVLSSGANDIVFINSDSLLEEYNYFNDLKTSLESQQDSIDAILKSKAKSLENEVMNYQEKAGMMSPDQRASTEEKLMMKQQQLMDLKQSYLEQLSDRESAMNDSLHENLIKYLHEYNQSKNYKFILGYQRGGGILFANDSLDITREVIEGLNAAQN